MKKLNYFFAWLTVLALTFTSCSKDETGVAADNPETVQLTFGALLNEFTQNRQASGVVCDNELVPAYVMVGLTDAEDAIPAENDLIEVGLKNNNGSWETTYSDDLAMPAGTYYLQHFVVYDANHNVVWVAPRTGGAFAEGLNSLPIQIDLMAGTKPYINVDVLCFIAREETAYGYPFFDFNVVEVENSYCVFVNYCDDGTGREYPANFRLDVWSDGYGGQELVATGMNTVDMSGAWPAADVLCLAIPEITVDGGLYARVTVLDDAQAYTPDATDFTEFRITQADINGQELFIPAYNHIRINCSPNGGGGDVTCNTEVRCQLNTETLLSDNCEFTYLENSEQGWVRVDNEDDFRLLTLIGPDEVELGSVDASIDNGEINLVLDTPYRDSDKMIAYAVEVRPRNGDVMSPTCWETKCANVVNEYDEVALTFDGFTYSYPFYMKVVSINCFSPEDFLD